mmetsp:Transcript_611/g.1737  ORF Transcript_611/g.1737 Transcript_611/m.1737 type:complete len:223 (-) Transcript_611:337-1005(-)
MRRERRRCLTRVVMCGGAAACRQEQRFAQVMLCSPLSTPPATTGPPASLPTLRIVTDRRGAPSAPPPGSRRGASPHAQLAIGRPPEHPKPEMSLERQRGRGCSQTSARPEGGDRPACVLQEDAEHGGCGEGSRVYRHHQRQGSQPRGLPRVLHRRRKLFAFNEDWRDSAYCGTSRESTLRRYLCSHRRGKRSIPGARPGGSSSHLRRGQARRSRCGRDNSES